MNIDDLLADSYAKPNSRNCFVSRLSGIAADYMEIIDENPESYARVAVHRNLKKIGVDIGITAVKTHMNGECKCRKNQKS